jgi:filamentous hemagglutinin family protein
MNQKAYRLVFSKRLGMLVPVALGLSIVGLGSTSAQTTPLPTGGQVVQGTGSISQTANTLTVNQSTQLLGVNWQSFNIGAGNTVQFVQPNAQAVAINRVLGNDRSEIFGNLKANGQVFLLNPNGVIFSSTAQVDVGALVASTARQASQGVDGSWTFTDKGTGQVINQGHIKAKDGGFVVLDSAAQTLNSGTIEANRGGVALTVAQNTRIALDGQGQLNVNVDGAVLQALVQNQGLILADGGAVHLSARGKNMLLSSVVNQTGVIKARSVQNRNGRIFLNGGDSGKVQVSGTLDVSGKEAGQIGGRIEVTGEHIHLQNATLDASGHSAGGSVRIDAAPSGSTRIEASTVSVNATAPIFNIIPSANGITTPQATPSTAQAGRITVGGGQITLSNSTLSASGPAGGGRIEVGGGYQGAVVEGLSTAQTTTVDETSLIDVSSTGAGNGGTAIVWSNQETNFKGQIDGQAKQAEIGGDGGFGEVSGKLRLIYQGKANMLAANTRRRTGDLLLDPYNLTISSGTGTGTTGSFDASADDSVLNVTTLQNALASANVTVTTGSSGTQTGNITLANALTWGGGNTTLTLEAAGGVIVNAGISYTGNNTGGLVLTAAGTGGITSTSAGSIALGVGTLTLNVNNAAASSTMAGNISSTTGTNNGNIIKNGAGFLTYTGTGTTGSNNWLLPTGSITVNAGTFYFNSAATINTLGGYPNYTSPTINTPSLIHVAAGAEFRTSRAFNGALNHTLTGSGTYRVANVGSADPTIDGNWTAFAGTVVIGGNINFGSVFTGSEQAKFVINAQLGKKSNGTPTNYTILMGSLEGTGNISIRAGLPAFNLTVGHLNTDGLFTGTIILDHSVASPTTRGTLTKVGTGTLALSADQFNGTTAWGWSHTVISGGTLQIGNGGTTGSLKAQSSAISIASGATLAYSRSNSLTVPDVMAGAGRLVKLGSGTLTLSAASTYSGGTTINGGTLQAANAAAFGSGAVTVDSGAALDLNGITMTSTGGLTLNGTGISGGGALFNSSSTGATYSGLVALGSAASVVGGTGTIALSNSGTITGSGFGLTLGGAAGGSVASIIGTDTGTLTKANAGTWSLTGASTYSGATTINAGTLNLGNGGSTGSIANSSVIVNDTGLFYVQRSDAITSLANLVGSGSSGITGTGNVRVQSNEGLTIDRNIALTGNSSAITLLAGNSTAAGTASGGDVSFGASNTLTTTTGGTVTIFSGNADTTTLDGKITGATGSKNKSYNAATADTSGAVSGARNLYYRQSPSVSVSGITASSKTYDGNTTAVISTASATTSGLVDNLMLQSTGVFNSKDVDTASDVNLTHTFGSSDGYSVSGVQAGVGSQTTAVATITPKALTMTGTTATGKTYDGNTSVSFNVGTLSGFVGSETVTASAAGTFDSANAGNRTATVAYTLANGTNGGLAFNYSLADTTISATISPKALTMTAQNASKLIGQADPTFTATYSGFVNGETSAVLTNPVVTRNGNQTEALTYTGVLVPSATSTNYAITTVNANFTIVPADTLLVTLGNVSKAYGASVTGLTATQAQYVTNGLVLRNVSLTPGANGLYTYNDNLGTTGSFQISTAATSSSAVGNYDITMTNFVKNGVNFTNHASQDANLTVNALAVTPGAVSVSKVYNGSTAAQATISVTNRVGSDDVSIVGVGSYTDNKNVGTTHTYSLNAQLTGAGAGNYYLSNATLTGANGVITPAPLTVTGSKNADGSADFTLNNATWTFSGTVSGETVSFTNVSATATSADAGTYSGVTLTNPVFAVANGLAANYSFPTSAALTINRARSSASESSNASVSALTNMVSKAFQGTKVSLTLFDGVVSEPPSGGYTTAASSSMTLSALSPFLSLAAPADFDGNGDSGKQKSWDLRKR